MPCPYCTRGKILCKVNLLARFTVNHSPRLPDVRPKTLLAVHDVLGIGRVRGDDLFLTLVARAFVKFAFVAECEATLLPTVRAVLRMRQVFLFVKLLFLLNNKKLFFARVAFCFQTGHPIGITLFLLYHNPPNPRHSKGTAPSNRPSQYRKTFSNKSISVH